MHSPMREQDSLQRLQSESKAADTSSRVVRIDALDRTRRVGLAEAEQDSQTGRLEDAPFDSLTPQPIDYLADLTTFGFSRINTSAYSILKRLFDIVFASAAIVSTTPLLVIISIAIKLTSRGPVFFTQDRVGKDGRIFKMLKFRTMRVADTWITDTAWRAADDPRRTIVGSLLRRTSLDELPQFFNVLVGQMSVVGPRPERPFFVQKFATELARYELRHLGEVGITGLAQIHGYRGDTCIATRLSYDLEYLENWSLRLDLQIVWFTIKGIFLSEHE